MMMKEIKVHFGVPFRIWINYRSASGSMVVGIYFFKFPNHFAFGGITGFSTVVSQLTHWSASDFTICYQYSPSAVRIFIPGQRLWIKDCIRNHGHVSKLITS